MDRDAVATSASSVQLDIARDRGDEKAQLVKFSEKSSQCAVQNRHSAPGHGPGRRDQHNMKIQPRLGLLGTSLEGRRFAAALLPRLFGTYRDARLRLVSTGPATPAW